MNIDPIFISLINNISLLFVMTVLYGIVFWRWPFGTMNKVISGIVFGCVAVAGMMIPLRLVPGVVFDGRSIIVALAGMTGGFIPAIIASLIASVCRLLMGSTGAITGTLVILASALIGVAYHYVLRLRPAASHPLVLYGFGIVVHAVMVLLMLTLPYPTSIHVIGKIAVPVMTIYPVGTFLIAFLLLQLKAKHEFDEKLKESEEKYRNIFENAVEGFYQTTPQGRFISANPAQARLFGYDSPQDLIRSISDIAAQHYVDPEQRRIYRDTLERDGVIMGFEAELVKRDGTPVWVSLNSRAVKGDDGTILFLEGTAEDITSRKKAEEELRRKKEELDSYFTSSLDLLCIANTSGHFVRLNPEWEKVLGHSIADLEGRPFLDLVHPEDVDQTIAAVSQLNAQKPVENFVNRYRCKDGSYRWIEWRSKPEGSMIYAVARDITARKATEDALRTSLKDKELLLKEIHHRVKNNLMTISSILSLQSGMIEDPKARDALEVCRKRIQVMSLIHNKLYRSTDLAHISFKEYADDLLADLFVTHERHESGIVITKDIEDISFDIDTTIPLGLILNELFSNAMKHAFRGRTQGTLSISLRRDGDRLCLTVKDDGAGFPEELDFRRTDSLGLELVNTLTEQLDGDLELERGNGTQIRITFASPG